MEVDASFPAGQGDLLVTSLASPDAPADASATTPPSFSDPSRRKRHAHAIVDDLFCVVCQVSCNSEASFLRHRESRRHQQMLHRPVTSQHPSQPAPSGPRVSDDDPFDVPPDSSAALSLATIFTAWWGTLEHETVQALFLLRRDQRVAGRLQMSARLRDTQSAEEHAELLLTIPYLLMDMAKRARALLACTDLPVRDPSLRLHHDQRLLLQRECLHRGLLTTSLADNTQLLHLAVHAALHNGTARAMITDTTFRMGYLASSFASLVWSSAALPDSAFHSAWHMDSSPSFTLASRGRSLSDSDVTSLTNRICDCRPPSAALHAVQEDAQQLKLEFLTILEDGGGQLSDDLGEKDDDDDDADYGDGRRP